MDATPSENICVFRDITECLPSVLFAPNSLTEARKSTIETASKTRKDNFYSTLGSSDNLRYHTNCYLHYISKNHIDRYLKKRKSEDNFVDGASSSKKNTRSSSVSFDFQKNCFICASECNVVADKKHPDRWASNKGFLCKTANRGKGVPTFKQVCLDICNRRGDAFGDEIRIRLEGAGSDLHAADARYHEKCLQKFENPKSTIQAQKDDPVKSPEQFAQRYVIRSIRNQPDQIWTSVQLHDIYVEKGGKEKNRHRFIDTIVDQMKEEIYVFSSPGLPNHVMLKEKASSTFKLMSKEDDDEDLPLQAVAKQIKTELKKFHLTKQSTHH